MSRFQFSLQRVLHWRSLELAREEGKLEILVREQIRLQTLKTQLSSEKSKLAASLSAMPNLRGEDLRGVTNYTLRLNHQAGRLHDLLVKCDRQISEQRTKYREAKQKFRLLEELKARKLADWRYQEAAELESLASESFLANWNRESR